MSRIRSALALVALGLFTVAGHAQTNPAISTIVAFSLSNPTGNLVQGADGALYGVSSPATSITGGVIYRTTLDGSDVRTLYQLKPDDALSPAGGLVLASDGDSEGDMRQHLEFITANNLDKQRYVISRRLGLAFVVEKLPFATLIDKAGVIRALLANPGALAAPALAQSGKMRWRMVSLL